MDELDEDEYYDHLAEEQPDEVIDYPEDWRLQDADS